MKDHYDTDGDGDREELYFDASRLYGLPGWKEITCVPGQYPSFKEPACNCLGDTHIGPDKSLEVSSVGVSATAELRKRLSGDS